MREGVEMIISTDILGSGTENTFPDPNPDPGLAPKEKNVCIYIKNKKTKNKSGYISPWELNLRGILSRPMEKFPLRGHLYLKHYYVGGWDFIFILLFFRNDPMFESDCSNFQNYKHVFNFSNLILMV